MSARVLIVYGSKYGQTAKISRRIGESLTRHAMQVTVLKGDEIVAPVRLEDFDGVIVGASVLGGRFQRYIEAFVFKYLNGMERIPNAFFAVSGAAGSPSPDKRKEALDCIDAFLDRTTWKPMMLASFGGAMAYTKYNPLMRWLLKLMSKRSGGPTDTSRDHEMTDWLEVERFAQAFFARVQISLTTFPPNPDFGAGNADVRFIHDRVPRRA